MNLRIRVLVTLAGVAWALGLCDQARAQFGPEKAPAGKKAKPPAGPIGEPGAGPRPAKMPPKGGPVDDVAPFGPARPPVANRPADRPRRPDPNALTKRPFPPLSPEEEAALDELLAKWEDRCSKITTYQCEIERWEFDPVHGPANPNVHKSHTNGTIRYAKPDKGMVHFEKVELYQPPPVDKPKGAPTYKHLADMEEKWICDGKALFEFNFRDKVLVERPLPEDQRGKAVADGPLPFMFNAEAAKMKDRYWLRIVTPDDVQGEHWIEAFPKRARDLEKHSRVTIILSAKDFLPAALEICDPSFRPGANEKRMSYKFAKREVNKRAILETIDGLKLFHKEFFQPGTPSGWKRSVEPFPVDDPDVVQRPEPSPKGKAPR